MFIGEIARKQVCCIQLLLGLGISFVYVCDCIVMLLLLLLLLVALQLLISECFSLFMCCTVHTRRKVNRSPLFSIDYSRIRIRFGPKVYRLWPSPMPCDVSKRNSIRLLHILRKNAMAKLKAGPKITWEPSKMNDNFIRFLSLFSSFAFHRAF